MAIATASDYAQMQREYNKNARGISDWERYFLEPLQQAYQTETQQIATQANYDISGAYSAYKKQQLQLLQNQQLASGFKEQVASNLLSGYEASISNIEQQAVSDILKKQETFEKTLAENTEKLTERGAQMSKIEDYILTRAGISHEQARTALGAEIEDGSTGKGIYTLDNEGNYVLTDYGRDFFASVMFDDSFADDLLAEDEDLYNFFAENKQTVRELVGGLSKYETGYDATGELSIKRRLSNPETAEAAIDAVKEPKLSFNFFDGSAFDTGESGQSKLNRAKTEVFEYGRELGLSNDEIIDIWNAGTSNGRINSDGVKNAIFNIKEASKEKHVPNYKPQYKTKQKNNLRPKYTEYSSRRR